LRRRTLLLVLVLGVALTLAGGAYAGNGGFAPETPHSPNANRINDSYKLIALLTGLIFILVESALIWFVVKYRGRGRGRGVDGPQIHAHTRLELIWTAAPVVILAIIAGFVFYKLPGIKNVPSAKAEPTGKPLLIRIDAHQFYWQFRYPNGAVSIDELHVPAGRTIRVEITSRDVDHSWWVPELGGKFDAIPGRTTHTWFKADRPGTYRGQCGEFCGVFHAEMQAHAIVSSAADFQNWISARARAQLGKSEWVGVCAKCHGPTGGGGYGPQISTNQLLVQTAGLKRLMTEGQNQLGATASYMPPVARGWNDEQFRALFAYLAKNVYKGPASGG
jgi:cytochrome c oxidase subunit II